MINGVVAGKFWPFHMGHALLLWEAEGQCDHLDVFLVGRPTEFPSPTDRVMAIYEYMAGADMTIHMVGDIETQDDTERSSEVWAKYTPAILGYTPDVVFSSEEYGVRWARNMGCSHIMVDQKRAAYNVSGTQVRENFYANSRFLPSVSKRLVLPRVVVMGAESTGTTTLADALGEHYNTLVVPEYGRQIAEDYKDEHGVAPPLDFWDDQIFRLVAHGQNALEERLAKSANGVLVCDTDSLATAVWYERYNDRRGSLYFDSIGYKQAEKHDLYIITSPEGIPWEDDGTRDGEDQREWMHESFVYVAKQAKRLHGVPYVIVKGDRQNRLQAAVDAVESVLDRSAYSVVQ